MFEDWCTRPAQVRRDAGEPRRGACDGAAATSSTHPSSRSSGARDEQPGAERLSPKDEGEMSETGYPPRQGLYDPQHEKDACGFGFVVDIKGRATHDIVEQATRCS
jgi:hypothetical protein